MARVRGRVRSYQIDQRADTFQYADGNFGRGRGGYTMRLDLDVDSAENPEGLGGALEVVVHTGSCDADRLGGLERERDEWRRRAEANDAAGELIDKLKYVGTFQELVKIAGYKLSPDGFVKRLSARINDTFEISISGPFKIEDFEIPKPSAPIIGKIYREVWSAGGCSLCGAPERPLGNVWTCDRCLPRVKRSDDVTAVEMRRVISYADATLAQKRRARAAKVAERFQALDIEEDES